MDDATPHIGDDGEHDERSVRELEGAFEDDAMWQRVHDKYLRPYHDEETQITIFQALSASFGLSAYKPNYILPVTYDFVDHHDDRRAWETAFQISLAKEFFRGSLWFQKSYGFAYTQRSWWQTMRQTKRFRETNYMPELYILIPIQNPDNPLKWYKFAYLHQSNGHGGTYGRSWDRIYAEALVQIGQLFVRPRVWAVIAKIAQSSDITDYLGYGDLTFSFPYRKHLFRLMVRSNFDFQAELRGAAELQWSYPLTHGTFIFVRGFTGYGESLIDYDKKVQRIGVGVAFSR
jgi:phospholipase A1